MNHETAANIVQASLIGDALALGPHWEYKHEAIAAKFGRVESFQDPMTQYHPGKRAGAQTHYGDQTLVLLRSLAAHSGFDLTQFATDWLAFWEDEKTQSYRDSATRHVLEKLKAGSPVDQAGSGSHDLGGAARIAPLFLLPASSIDEKLAVIRAETAFTHSKPEVVEAAEYFCRVVLRVADGAKIDEALHQVMEEGKWTDLKPEWLEGARQSAAGQSSDTMALYEHGLTCSTDEAFRCVCHLLLRHPGEPVEALIENVNAGGDSAARSLVLGMVYGAKFSVDLFPKAWLSDWRAREEVDALITKLA